MINDQDILQTVAKTLEVEIKTLRDLKDSIDINFIECVKGIYSSKGRVVITGVGKSALIGQKIVATLNSTGTPALFMHAADAVHGDLGMIGKEDVLICLSKSGETAEIKVLIPILKGFGNLLIGVTANKESYLAKNADYFLFTPVSEEADPNNLAPTASSISQLAVGDALASALLKVRGFSNEQFARFHPGGSLGKQLYLRILDIYPNNEKPLVRSDTNIREVILEITSKRLGVTVVCNEEDQVLGIITDGDLRRMIETFDQINHLTAKDIMTLNPKNIEPEALAVEAFRMMQNNSITQIIVVEKGIYKGVVHIHDLIQEGIV